jgi:hypothetical protein
MLLHIRIFIYILHVISYLRGIIPLGCNLMQMKYSVILNSIFLTQDS